MPSALWQQEINFTSALLLHSCITVLLKELLNVISIALRLTLFKNPGRAANGGGGATNPAASVVLDGYTSVLSRDYDAELAELYFTNTGLILLTISLASAIAMNLLLPDLALNVIVAGTFGLCYIVSALMYRQSRLRLVLALRRAGRFIWSDTPFVNFFSLIYVAVVLYGVSTLKLRDYIALRSVAVAELVFVKAYIASASIDKQIALLRALRKTQLVVITKGKCTMGLTVCKVWVLSAYPHQCLPRTERDSIRAFTTTQRMAVMLLKTTVGHDGGSVRGPRGPSRIPVPGVGFYLEDDTGADQWRIYRVREDVLAIADCLRQAPAKGMWMRFLQHAHGVLLRTLGKVRVVYLLKGKDGVGAEEENSEGLSTHQFWQSNVNFVSGVSQSVLQRYSLMQDDTAYEEGIVV